MPLVGLRCEQLLAALIFVMSDQALRYPKQAMKPALSINTGKVQAVVWTGIVALAAAAAVVALQR